MATNFDTIVLKGPKEINKQPFLLFLAEHLAEIGRTVVYITQKLSKIAQPLHGTTRKTDAFAKIQFRYLENQEELIKTLFDSSFYEKLAKNPYTLIVDGLESYCDVKNPSDIAKVSAAIIGTTPQNQAKEGPRIVTSLNIPRTTKPDFSCEILYSKVWNIKKEGDILKFNENDFTDFSIEIQFDCEKINFKNDELLKLKKIILKN